MSTIRIREGFTGQILHVIPRSIVASASSHPLLYPLMPTDIGWYPQARYHYCARETGAPEHILILCAAGSGWYEFNRQMRPLQAGEALFLPRSQAHIYGASESDPWSIHWVHFVGSSADYLVNQLLNGIHTLKVDAEAMRHLDQLFRQCYDLFLGGFVLHRLIYVSQILHHILGCLVFHNRAFSPTQRTSRFHNLDATLAYLQDNLDQPLTLREMADHAELSVSHFSHLFREQTGYSPMDYFIHLKIQHACTLLTLTRKTIREISFAIGYDDPYYFSRIFKKVMGLSPRAYRSGSGDTVWSGSSTR
jgi:AraC-like DNA-binding protein